MESYFLIIDGQKINTNEHKYFLKADEVLKDVGKSIALEMQPLSTLRKLSIRYIPRFLLKSPEALWVRSYLSRYGAPNIPWEELEKVIYAKCPIASLEEVDGAIKSAKKASLEFRKTSLEFRAKLVENVREELKSNEQLLKELSVMEGRPVKSVADEFEALHKVLHPENISFLKGRLEPDKLTPSDYIVKIPYGVFGIATPYNGPLIGGIPAIVSAILSGNACMVKPSLKVPISTIKTVEIFHKTLDKFGVPLGLINVVMGDGKKIVEAWLDSPDVSGIVFYGDSRLGMRIGAEGLQRGKKVILEITGSDAIVVWKDADIEKAIEDVIRTRFRGSGQFCIATKRAFVHVDVYEQFVQKLLAGINDLEIGLPSDPKVDQAPIGRISILAHLKEVVREAVREGATIMTGGNIINHKGERSDNDLFFEPTVLVNVKSHMRVMQEEVFGPVLPIMQVANIGEAIQLMNSSPFGLRASVWSENAQVIKELVNGAETGSVMVNSSNYYTGLYSPHLGGTKLSGVTGAKYFTDQMCYRKYVHTNPLKEGGEILL